MRPVPGVPRARDYGRIVVDSWLVILLATMLSAATGLVVAMTREPIYGAQVQLFARVDGAPSVRAEFEGSRGALSRMQTYAVLATSQLVARRTADDVGGRMTADQVARAVTATVTPGSALLTIEVTGTDRGITSDTANAVATNLMAASREIEWTDDGPAAWLVLVDGATSSADKRGSWAEYCLLGGLIGLLLSTTVQLIRGIAGDKVLSANCLGHVVGEALAWEAR